MPPMEKPISWVDITTIHWSNGEDMRFGQYHWRDQKKYIQMKLYCWL